MMENLHLKVTKQFLIFFFSVIQDKSDDTVRCFKRCRQLSNARGLIKPAGGLSQFNYSFPSANSTQRCVASRRVKRSSKQSVNQSPCQVAAAWTRALAAAPPLERKKNVHCLTYNCTHTFTQKSYVRHQTEMHEKRVTCLFTTFFSYPKPYILAGFSWKSI